MAANGFCWGMAAAPNWYAGAATGAAGCPAFDPAEKLKLGVECAEKENGLEPLSLLLLLPLAPNWKGAAGWLFTFELDPNSNAFFDCGSSPVDAPDAAKAPNGLLALVTPPNADGAAPKVGAAFPAVAEGAPNAGTGD